MDGYRDWSTAGWRQHLPGVADVPAFAEGLAGDTIPGLAAASAVTAPGRIAVIVDGEPVTHAELDDGAARVAGWLARRVRPGDRVLLAATASVGFVRCYLGALRAGAVVVLANPGYTAAELGHLVADSETALAFADPEPARLLAGLRAGPEPVPTIDVRTLPEGARPATGIAAGPHDIALLAYTSGTTGTPKGVPLTHGQLAASIRSAMAAWRWSPEEILAHALPLYHQHGLSGVHAVLAAGGTVHIRSRFTPADLAGTVRRHRASVLFAVPTMYQALVDDGPRHRGLLAGARLAVCGSAPLTALLAKRLASELGRTPLVRYGLTETGLNVSHRLAAPRPGSVGIPLPGVLVRLWADNAAAAPGADGEIQVRGPHVFHGYPGNPSATAESVTPDGWFRTGDIGRLDPAAGDLVIRGRIKEMIITGGLNVYPREVETVLEEHRSVAEAAVAGVAHPHWGEQVTAWITVRPGYTFDEAALIEHAHTALAGYKCPKRIYVLAALPRTPLGKLQRAALRPPSPT